MTCLQLCALFNFQICGTFPPVIMNIFSRSRCQCFYSAVMENFKLDYSTTQLLSARKNTIEHGIKTFLNAFFSFSFFFFFSKKKKKHKKTLNFFCIFFFGGGGGGAVLGDFKQLYVTQVIKPKLSNTFWVST